MYIIKLVKKVVWFFLGLPLQGAPMSLRTLDRFDRKLPVFIEQHTSRKIFWGLFEQAETKFFLKALQPSDVCLDIGANVGYYTALFASKAGKVIAIDPVSQNASLIRLAQAMNRDNNLEVIQAAVGASIGREEFIEYQQTSLSGLASTAAVGLPDAADSVRKYTVDTITIDSLELERLDVVKIDIEGGEFGALLGMSDTIQRTKPRLFMMELVDEHLTRAGQSLDEVLRLMDSWGYDARVLGDKGLEHYRGAQPRNDNFIFIRH